MSNTYYSPQGNAEVWNKKPTGYFTVTEWNTKVAAEEAIAKEEAERAYLTYDNMLRDKTAEVNTKFTRAMAILSGTYPKEEADTFTTQETAARSFITGSSEYIPYLTTLADARETTVTELVQKILTSADKYHKYSALYVGTRHKYLDLLATFSPDTDPSIIRDIEVIYDSIG